MTKAKRIGPMLRLVLAAGAVLQPLARPLLKRRLARGKEDPDRWLEKLGVASAPRPDGTLIWLHGVGLGEVMALRGLIDALAQERPDMSFLVTSSARSSGEVFARNLPPRTTHQYLPLDVPAPVRAFLDHWKPDLAVWSDQEVWPRFAVSCARRAIPQAYVAARITDVSARARARFGQAYGDLYRLLDARHAQEDTTAQHLADLMGDDTPVAVSGALKAAAAPLAEDPDLAARLPRGRKIWLAASAHPADIDLAIAAQKTLLDAGDNRLLIIAPRRLDDAKRAQERSDEATLTHCKRSDKTWPDATTNVFIADSFGELGTWYRAAEAALIGGTFDATQGHNPWEAVALDCAVLHGPNTANFASDYAQLDAAKAATQVNTAKEIVKALQNPDLKDITTRARAVRDDAARGLKAITDDLLSLLKV